MRDNLDLDDIFLSHNGGSVNQPAKEQRPRRRKTARSVTVDQIRQRAFPLLALLTDLDAPARERVLRTALRMHRA